MLSDFLTDHREVLLSRARDKVLQRRVPLPTDYELRHGVPIFLDQLAETLRLEAEGDGLPIPEMRPATVVLNVSRSNATLRPARAPRSVPSIQPATAATMWSSVEAIGGPSFAP